MEILSEDHRMVAEAADGFLAQSHSISAFRALRDSGAPLGYDPAILSDMAELGWMGIVLPEEMGGADFGFRAAGLIAESMGRNLTAAPFLSTAILSATILRQVGGPVAAQWGPKIAAGEAVIALALEEGAKHRPERIATGATRTGDGFVLGGRKSFVVDGFGADRLIVVALLDGAPALFWVDPTQDGVTVAAQILLDHRNAASVMLEDVQLDASALLAEGEAAANALSSALAAGRAVTAAEQLGVARVAAETTNEYLRTRKQFGTLIGRFQALQHRAADLYCEIEQTASLVSAALNALDAGAENAEALSRAAKAKTATTGRQATEEGVQMHGGIGMTDELDLGLFMKRDRALTEFLGDAGHHTNWLLRQRGL
ncbi:acyl-CoA dehydrogenase family protein [Shimia aestuarii]|uniref:Acyl-CoA dehydrogenase, N-terminal domain n=1 Tax=Shimia aestuarii TaxID=254406 RepID=A0A1I4S8N0_9RHOB|nr:acyl-CoA dehydrogenase family protein [Shimia aestuarii]SFM60866.1 Acyl-CoA dehydrogenase, N-terminal domain [Shimia aestuarii]